MLAAGAAAGGGLAGLRGVWSVPGCSGVPWLPAGAGTEAGLGGTWVPGSNCVPGFAAVAGAGAGSGLAGAGSPGARAGVPAEAGLPGAGDCGPGAAPGDGVPCAAPGMTVPALPPPGWAAGCTAGGLVGVAAVAGDPAGAIVRAPPAVPVLGGGCTQSARSGPPAL